MSELRTIDTGGARLACRVAGDDAAPALVLLHALGEDGSTWAATARRLAGRYQVYAPDLRGHGHSDRCPEYSFELMRDDVLGLLDTLGRDQVTLVGHSMGAVVAYLLAGERPERVDRLVLEEPPPPVPADPARILTEEEREEPASFDWKMAAAIYRQRNAPDPAYWNRLAAITAPTLIVAGGSGSHLPQNEMTRMARTIPDCRLITIEAGHLVHEKEPEEFTARVEAFLS
ncbi:MAG: alpha/beta hydrolase [Actinoallomurus sp.]|jgi:3-oxoadipate enol-lactonase|nr:alpha/beta hydrolase [Actinoallomurus sp.]